MKGTETTMNLLRNTHSQRLLLAAATLLLFVAASPLAHATNPSASGNLTVTATVNSSLAFQFVSDGSGVALSSITNTTNGSASTATLNFNGVNEYGSNPGGVTVNTAPASTLCSSCWSVSSPVDIDIVQANGGSSNYTLKASLQAAASNGESLSVNGGTALSTTPAQVTATGAYGTAAAYTVSLGIPNTSTAGSFSDVIVFSVVAN